MCRKIIKFGSSNATLKKLSVQQSFKNSTRKTFTMIIFININCLHFIRCRNILILLKIFLCLKAKLKITLIESQTMLLSWNKKIF